MKLPAMLILLLALPLHPVIGGEKRVLRDYSDHLAVALSFVDSEGGKFIVTVTNLTKSNQAVLAETKRFHGIIVGMRPDGSKMELIDPEYLRMVLTSAWLDPQTQLAPSELLVWEIPISKLVDRKKYPPHTRSHPTRKDLEGVEFIADFERLGVVPRKERESFNDRNAAQKSAPVTIAAQVEQGDADQATTDAAGKSEDNNKPKHEAKRRSP